jgi:hypothetical protein
MKEERKKGKKEGCGERKDAREGREGRKGRKRRKG